MPSQRTTKLTLRMENAELMRKLRSLEKEYDIVISGRVRTERELAWVKQQFEFLLRALQDFGWPRRIEYRADIGAKTADALIRDPEERRTNPVR